MVCEYQRACSSRYACAGAAQASASRRVAAAVRIIAADFRCGTGSAPTVTEVRLSRIPLTLRALVLVPLLAAGLDQVRASLVCGPGAHTCLEAADQSGMGVAGVLVLVLYALGSGLLVARLARGRRASAGLWAVGTAGP